MKAAPDPIDVQEFLFKQSSICQLLDEFSTVPVACSLLAADRKRGLLYIGRDNKIIVAKPGIDAEPEWKIELELPGTVSKLSLNCDCSYLAVAQHSPAVSIYDASALSKNSLQLLHEIRVSSSNPDVFVNDLKWNPTISGMLCTVASDHTIGNFQIEKEKEKPFGLEALERLNGMDILCAAWSPKGKQIVVGCKNGNLVQLKPDLKVARLIPGPDPYIGEVITVLWISNFQFCAAYLDNAKEINVLIIDAPKGETTATFTCYEDITYGMPDLLSEGSMPRYYFDHVPEWGLIIAASSGSSEVAVLGSKDGGANWDQWQLVDHGRAQLPLIHTAESYPVGITIDRSPTYKLPWDGDSTLPHPVPILHILGTSGQLCSYHMVNLTPNCPAINTPPTEVVKAPLRLTVTPPKPTVGINAIATSTPRAKEPETVPEPPKPVPMGNIFGESLKPTNLFQQVEPVVFQQPKPKKSKVPEAKPGVPVEINNKIEPVKEVLQSELVKTDIKLPTMKEFAPQEPVEQKLTVDDNICIRTYLEKHRSFEKELRSRLEVQTWECGSEEERKQLAERAAEIDRFLRELKETTNSLSSDIAYLKALLLQSFAWVEEAKSKNSASIDTRNCGDSSKVPMLQQLYYYTQTQLTQATKILDLKWADHRSQEKSQMKIPSLEFVYQNLVLQNKIITEEKHRVERLAKRWKSLARTNSISNLNHSMSSLHIISPKSTTSLRGNTGVIEARCKAIASRTLNFTQAKQIKLRQLLSESPPRIIRPINPSPIQDRMKTTLSSLALSSVTSPEAKNKVEQPVAKQTPVSKPVSEKSKQQSPLASLNNIVARIGSTEINGIVPQNKSPHKLPSVSTPFPSLQTTKFPQVEQKQSPIIPRSGAQVNPTSDVNIPFGQMNSSVHTTSSLSKAFPKVDSIPFGTPLQKPQETMIPKPLMKEQNPKTGTKLIPNSEPPKVESKLFSTSSLKDVLPTDVSVAKTQSAVLGTVAPAVMATMTPMTTTTTTTKSDAMSMFSFATASVVSTVAKTTPQNPLLMSQPANHQTFSFVPKPATTAPSTLKLSPPPVQSQAQDVLSAIAGLSTGLPAATTSSNSNNSNITAISCYQITAAMPGVETITTTKEIFISIRNGTSPPNTITTTSSVVIEEIPSVDSRIPSFIGTPVPAVPSGAPAAPIFGGQSTIPIFGGATTTTATVTVTTTAPAVVTAAAASSVAAPIATTGALYLVKPANATTTTAPTGVMFEMPLPTSTTDIFKGFSSAPTTTGNLNTTTASATTAPSPFYSSLSNSVFGEATPALSMPSFTGATSTPTTTLGFGSFKITPTTTTAASTFDKTTTPGLSTNTQFPSTPTASSPSGRDVFGKPIISPPSMPNTSLFGNASANTTGGSIFSGSNTSPIFGTTTSASPVGSIFAKTPSRPDVVFGGASNTSTMSFFGGPAAAGSPSAGEPAAGSPSIFGGGSTASSPMGLRPAQPSQPAFGQAAFAAKPVFGSVFGTGFGTPAFGANPTPAFGGPATLGSSPPIDNNMSKVFGNTSGSTTFESLANQSGGLTFGSLAQKSPEIEKPAFTGGSSFSSWR